MPLARSFLEMRVTYDAPAISCRRVLRILPQHRPGQSVLKEEWECTPPTQAWNIKPDQYGNRRLLLRHECIERQFVLHLTSETAVDEPASPLPAGPFARQNVSFLLPSKLIPVTAQTRRLARSLAWKKSGLELLRTLGCVTRQTIKYDAVPDPTPLPLPEVVRRGSGSCQDMSHHFISLCRGAGFAARYVAGFNPAEGLMHSWVEVLLDGYWIPYDPTHGRPPSSGCVVVAVGRDYRDTRPIAGNYRGGSSTLELRCATHLSPLTPPSD